MDIVVRSIKHLEQLLALGCDNFSWGDTVRPIMVEFSMSRLTKYVNMTSLEPWYKGTATSRCRLWCINISGHILMESRKRKNGSTN